MCRYLVQFIHTSEYYRPVELYSVGPPFKISLVAVAVSDKTNPAPVPTRPYKGQRQAVILYIIGQKAPKRPSNILGNPLSG